VVTEAKEPAVSRRAHWGSPWLYPVVGLASVVFLWSGIGWINPDQNWYLNEGLRLAQGKGYSYNLRPPLFPALLAGAFRLLGPDLSVGHLVVKLAYCGITWLAFFLGRKLYSTAAGVTAAVLVGLSPFLWMQSWYVMTDGVQALFMLLMLYAVVQALEDERNRLGWWIVGGLACGAAFYIKETGFLWAAVPVMAWVLVPRYRTRKKLLGVTLFGGIVLLVLLAWWVYFYLDTGQIYLLATVDLTPVGSGSAATAAATPGLPARLAAIATHSWDYLAGTLQTAFPLYPLYLIGWLYAGWRALRGSRFDLILIISALVYFPLVLVTVGTRAPGSVSLRNFIPVLALSLLVTGRWLAAAAYSVRRLKGACPSSKWLAPLLLALLVGGVTIWSQWVDPWAGMGRAEAVGGDPEWDANWYNRVAQHAAATIADTVPPGSHIMATWQWSSQIDFWTAGAYDFSLLPIKKVNITAAADGLEVTQDGAWGFIDNTLRPKPADRSQLLFVERRTWLSSYFALWEADVTQMVLDNEIEYFLFTGDTYYHPYALLAYFDGHPGYTRVSSYSEQVDGTDYGYVLFHINRAAIADQGGPLIVGAYTLRSLLSDGAGNPIDNASCLARLADLNPYGVRIEAARTRQMVESPREVQEAQALLEACVQQAWAADPGDTAASILGRLRYDQGAFDQAAAVLSPHRAALSPDTQSILHTAELVQRAAGEWVSSSERMRLLGEALASGGMQAAFVRNVGAYLDAAGTLRTDQQRMMRGALAGLYGQRAALVRDDFRGVAETADTLQALGAVEAAQALYRDLPLRWPANADAWLLAARAEWEAGDLAAAGETIAGALAAGRFDGRIEPVAAAVIEAYPHGGSERAALIERLRRAVGPHASGWWHMELGKLLLE